MVYLIYGQDLAKLNYHLDKIKLENSESELIRTDGQIDKNFVAVNLYTPPMLTSKRLVILENLEKFEKIEFSKINHLVDVVILQKGRFKPKIANLWQITIIEAKTTHQIFKFLDNLTFSPPATSISQLLTILKTEEPNFVFHQIITHIRRLILAKSSDFFANLNSVEKLADWQIRKYRQITATLNFSQLRQAFKILLAAEIEAKTGKRELSQALPILIFKLTQIFKNL